MLKGFAYRLLWWIPTILGILAITFCMVKLAPGDPVEALLDQDISFQPSAEAMYELYNQSAESQGLNRPSFYISITPYHYDQSFYHLPYIDQRLCKRMLERGMKWNACQELLTAVHQALLSDEVRSDLKQQLRGLMKEANFIGLSTILTNELGHELSTIPTTIRSSYIPKFYWHGWDNQFHDWVANFFSLDFGRSVRDGQSVKMKILVAIRWTLVINISSIFIAYFLAIPLGVYAGWYEHSRLDRITNAILTLFYAIPVFWMATILVVFFSTSEFGSWTNIFPPVGIWYAEIGESFGAVLKRNLGQFAIPVFTLSTAMMAYIARQVRGSVATEKQAAYIFQARAKGLSEHRIIWRHAFRNASFPLITMLGSVLPATISGSLVVEIICNIPGMGRLLYDSIYHQDWPVLVGIVSASAILTILGLMIADWLYRVADPRLLEAKL